MTLAISKSSKFKQIKLIKKRSENNNTELANHIFTANDKIKEEN